MRWNVSENGCWNWVGAKIRDYGVVSINGQRLLAHRVVYALMKRGVPHHLSVCHRCDNPSCVNPEHLFLGTQKTNLRDMLIKNRGHSRKGEASHMSKLTESQVLEIRKLHQEGNHSYRSLGRQFKVHHGSISKIITRQSWSHI